MRGADRDAKVCRSDEGESAGGFRGEAAEGIELGDALTHGFDNAPATSHGAAAQDKGTETCAGHGSTPVAAHKSVRRAGGEAENESDEIPGDGPEESRQKNLLIDHLNADHAFSDGLGDGSAENEGGNEVPE